VFTISEQDPPEQYLQFWSYRPLSGELQLTPSRSIDGNLSGKSHDT
jgi:hypothetical protein